MAPLVSLSLSLGLSPSHSVPGRFWRQSRLSSVDPPAPSPLASLGATEGGGEHNSSAGGPCIAVEVAILDFLLWCCLLECCLATAVALGCLRPGRSFCFPFSLCFSSSSSREKEVLPAASRCAGNGGSCARRFRRRSCRCPFNAQAAAVDLVICFFI
jgi:hypothetical protein